MEYTNWEGGDNVQQSKVQERTEVEWDPMNYSSPCQFLTNFLYSVILFLQTEHSGEKIQNIYSEFEDLGKIVVYNLVIAVGSFEINPGKRNCSIYIRTLCRYIKMHINILTLLPEF